MRGILAIAICIALGACAFAGEDSLRYVNKIPVYVVDANTGEQKCTCGDGCDCYLTGVCPNNCPAKFKRPEPGYQQRRSQAPPPTTYYYSAPQQQRSSGRRYPLRPWKN